jgi:type II restriction enzyme
VNLELNPSLASDYKSPAQIARVVTESWFKNNSYCPNCGRENLEQFANNEPVADFYCSSCKEQYELKSKRNAVGKKIVDGAYKTMLERISSQENPSFFLLTYNRQSWRIRDFLVVPKHFFVSQMIEQRKPLPPSARRAGWVGCNIVMESIPESGKIFFVRESQIIAKKHVLEKWQHTAFLKTTKPESKGWLVDVLNCLDNIPATEFDLEDVYAFESELKELHPENNHIKDKIRQQLQFLRNKGLLEFKGRGKYKKLSLSNG